MPVRIVAANYGGPEVLEQQTFGAPPLEPHEVRVDIKAAGVNPFDVKSYSGVYSSDPSLLPIKLGFEAAGVVNEVSSGELHGPLGPINVGDEVIVFRTSAAYTDQLVAKSASILHKPASLTWEQAGSMMTTGVTAAHCMVATGVTKGDTVLIHGGAGGVGLTAVQLAVAAGANVIATASEPQHELLHELGVTPVKYGDGLLDRVRAASPDGVDVAIDLVGTDEALDVSLQVVQTRDRIATIANFTRAPKEGVQLLNSGKPEEIAIRDAARLQLLDLVRSGQLRLFVEQVFSFDDVAEAHKAIATGHTHGKIVLVPA